MRKQGKYIHPKQPEIFKTNYFVPVPSENIAT